MKNLKSSALFFLAALITLAATQSSCKKQDTLPATSKPAAKKMYFYFEKVSKAGDTSRTKILVVK